MIAHGVVPMHGCPTDTGKCYCRPENCDGKGACGKIIDADESNKTLTTVAALKPRSFCEECGDTIKSDGRPDKGMCARCWSACHD